VESEHPTVNIKRAAARMMMRQMGVLSQALLVGLSITAISIGVGLLVPIPDQGRGGSSGAECALMAQALRAAPEQYRIIASDRSCSWRRLGISNAISAEALPPEARMPNRSVMSPRYSLFGYKAELDVGVTLAELAGSGKDCTYYRFFGRWHRAGCEDSWIA
jgi:hypothetical protein